MTIADLLCWWLALYGVTFTLCDAKIISGPRFWVTSRSAFMQELLGCYFCMGFWVSLAASLVRFWQHEHLAQQSLLHGFAGASFCFGFNSLLLTCESNARHPPQE